MAEALCTVIITWHFKR